MLGTLYDDAFKAIVSNSRPRDIYQIKCINKYHYQRISANLVIDMVIQNIERRLRQHFGTYYDNFVTAISKNKISIAGSFITQCALDEDWPDADIDLYTYSRISPQIFDWTIYAEIQEYYIHRKYCTSSGIIRSVCLNTGKVRLTELSRSPMHPNLNVYISNTYNIDACRNIYKYEDDKHVLEIGHLSSIMNKEVTANANNILQTFLSMQKKYIDRGFSFRKENPNHIKYDDCIIQSSHQI